MGVITIKIIFVLKNKKIIIKMICFLLDNKYTIYSQWQYQTKYLTMILKVLKS
jgi:hypothetical protein